MTEKLAMKIAIGFIIFFMSIPLAYGVLKFSLRAMGYYPCATGCWDIAQQFIENGTPATECYKIIVLDIGPRPPTSSFRAGCYDEVVNAQK